MKRYFEKPVQCAFRDVEGDYEWLGGIAYQDKIICGCCGYVLDVNEYAEEDFHVYPNWCNIAEEIIGGCPPSDDIALDIIL